MNKIIICIGIGVLVLVGLVWIARPDVQNASSAISTNSNWTLIVEEDSSYDFGSISMAAGKVKHTFKIKNTSNEAVVISKMYTSCMCTTATLAIGSKQFGPFGMPGHGATPLINQTINPNEEASVEVVFDPAAHGPAGVGRIQRVVTLENNSGQQVELQFSAAVTP
ncbi:hypothetical protein A3D68_00110 [Candidatus Adlerbacteria bacterium RIFCSPHIGHO2_02_FULL_52_17]|uniref:DUF1573 domain-containing protein n=1 Tax=Candidatus Adlerbacteria bacterium RIFCSPHIGHO2_02_FULL_52_17 TaxID=1797240 RepID=A0A1F4XQC5_9BACT|nr:MAG: hypothetical protein A3D68_00110 [Candidatus Adlerbacteria bacterium RIFCSPHIGHO2_02_FULL_52_17]